MFFTFTNCLLALVPLALVPITQAATHDVTVGGTGILAFTPESITANAGDTVVFTFKQKNHTATQSTLASPCTKLDGGFDSGFIPVAANNTNGPFPVAHFTVTSSTKPVWVFCAQTGHCQSGMVFAINPGNNFTTFKNNAQSGGGSPPANSGSSPPASGTTNHQVSVGANGALTYDPPEVSASPGDTVTFTFMSKNHTVTQSSFAAPCEPLAATSTTGQVGIDSGFMPVANGSTNYPTYTLTVNGTTPIWIYCRQTGHCGKGMVFAVNAVDSGPNNYTAFQNKAEQLNGTASSGSPAASGAVRTTGLTVGRNALVLVVAGLVAWLAC